MNAVTPFAIDALPPIAERDRIAPEQFAEVVAAYRPVVLRGQVADWPAVGAGRAGLIETAHYVASFGLTKPTGVLIGAPQIGGRFFYSDDMAGFNFRREQTTMAELAVELVRLSSHPNPPAYYAGAAAAADHLPGWTDANRLDLPVPDPTPRVWIGNASVVSTHYDVAPNLACVAAGERRFLLFPPEQLSNLYVGPLENTIAGQPVSMVDPDAPDLERFPLYAEALAHAQVAVLKPGDAIFIPSLWWHQVRSSGPLNILVNYWFGADPTESPFSALVHGLLSIRDLPPGERTAWRAWFDHYVFADTAPQAGAHLPEHARGVIGAPGAGRTATLKGYLSRALGLR
ncbi:cupin-like domain-containing protein [Sphingomonas japonica]|uniref:JmjC domain-containing protein n=1 Tax=Sphingomonas japonica TaxID=511662 RepID=A0ABX0U0H5_9SPHN|nr:cupin-like domain-containing protein [Sphingomonas japonica]NIJ22887.1 hypothetical protein [Sphingomonas japonica]